MTLISKILTAMHFIMVFRQSMLEVTEKEHNFIVY
jgi:hypothetical protein